MAYSPLTLTLASNGVYASASSEFASSLAAYIAFDKDPNTFWSTTALGVAPCWIQYDFQSVVNVDLYSIQARHNASDGAPSAWAFEAYDSILGEWVVLDQRFGESFSAGEIKSYNLVQTASYSIFRLYIYGNNGRTTTNIAEFEMYESDGVQSTSIRTTQSVSVSLTKTDSSSRLTQSAILYLHNEGIPARTTQAAFTYAEKTDANLRVTQAANLVLHTYTPCITQRAQVWKITRQDGITFAFTTHDEPVTFMNLTYKPCDSLRSSASDSGVINSGSIGDTTINGLISDTSITDFDLANGLFDGATIEVWVVPWGDAEFKSDSPQRIAAGVLGKTTQGDISYTAEMLSPGSKLTAKPLLDTFTPACRWALGDGRCPVDLPSLTEVSTVESVVEKNAMTQSTKRQFFDSILTGADGYYDFGVLTWTTGNNVGISSEIKTYLGDVVTLWKLMPHEILPGDEYQITPGCNKTEDDHTNKFGLDMVDFGGFPDIPGFDELIKTPNAKG